MTMPLSSSPTLGSRSNALSGTLVPTAARALPLRSVHASVDAADGLARLVLRQRFENPHDAPLEVIYSLPLPPEAAVSGFSFLIGSRRVVGEIDERGRARARYDEAMALGHTAALAEQDRDTLFTQALGNIPAGTAVEAEIVIDMKLRFIEGGSWELRLPTTVAPRYLGEVGRVEDAARIAQEVADAPMPVRLTLEARIRGIEAFEGERMVESPSHAIGAAPSTPRTDVVARFMDAAGVPLDRDVVLRWRASLHTATTRVRVTRPHGSTSAFALLTITPPGAPSARASVGRDLILLLDTSGSMGGLPIEQAKRVSLALVESLGESDTLEMIAFSSSPQRWSGGSGAKRGSAMPMTRANREAAIGWLSTLRASGGTEMREAILAALQPLRIDAQRQVILVTDGLIGFESEIVRTIVDGLPRGSRVHTVGVGSGINRTLTAGAARAGRGVEVIADASEDPERIAARIVARTRSPLVTDMTFRGEAIRQVAPSRLPDLFAGAPLVAAVMVDPAGGPLVVEGRDASGAWRVEVSIPACAEGEGLAAIEQLYARERAADLEMDAAAGENVDEALIAVGVTHRIATRLTSWVAITEEKTVDETAPFRRERMPHELPHGGAVEGFGLRSPSATYAPSASYSASAKYAGAGALGGGGPSTGAPPPPPASFGAPRTRAAAPSPAAPKELDGARRPGSAKEEGAEAPKKKTFAQRVLAPLMRRGGGPGSAKGGAPLLSGRVVNVLERSLILELTLTADYPWVETASAELVLADGTKVTVRLGRNASRLLPAGTTVRMVVELDAPLIALLQGSSHENLFVSLDLPDGTIIALGS